MSDIDPRSLREELEIRVIALLTGEISEKDADELEKILSVDEELSEFRDRMAVLIGDVHSARDEIAQSDAPNQMRLSDERRREIFGELEVPAEEPTQEKQGLTFQQRLMRKAAVITVFFFISAFFLLGGLTIQKYTAVEYAYFEAPERVDELEGVPEVEVQMSPRRSVALSTEIPPELIEGTPQPVVLEARGLSLDDSIHHDAYSARAMVKKPAKLEQSEHAIDQVELAWAFGFNEDESLAESKKERANSQTTERFSVSTGLSSSSGGSDLSILGDRVAGGVAGSRLVESAPVDAYAYSAPQALSPAPVTQPMVLSVSDFEDASAPRNKQMSKISVAQVSVELPAMSESLIVPEEPSVSYGFISAGRSSSEALGFGNDGFSVAATDRDFDESKGVSTWGSQGGADAQSELLEGVAGAEQEQGEAQQSTSRFDAIRLGSKLEVLEEVTREQMVTEVDSSWERPQVFDINSDAVTAPKSESIAASKRIVANSSEAIRIPEGFENAEAAGEFAGISVISITAGTEQEFLTRNVSQKTKDSNAVIAYDDRYLFGTQVAADSNQTIEQRQRNIVIPQMNFSGLPLSKVVETIEELSVEYDPERRGVPINYAAMPGQDPLVNISLRNLSVDRALQFVTEQVNHEVVVVDDRIRVQSKGQSAAELVAVNRAKNTKQTPKPEKLTKADPVSTFSLNVSDVSFKLAQAALNTQRIPDATLIRTEEFVNSFSYGDPAPREDEAVSLNWEIAQHPYEHNRQIVRFSLQTQAAGRAANQPLNLNLLLDNSGSMQRPDRRAILEKSLESLQAKLTDQDQLNIVLFARQPKLIANATTVDSQQAAIHEALNYQPEGGTNIEAGLDVAYETAQANFNPAASNRVILMTDGAANLGDVNASTLADKVIEQRKQGVALDAYGIGWEDYNDALLEEITRNGDGRYAFLNSVDSAAEDFAEKLAGTLRVAAADVKVQILWNPERVQTYRQIGYDLHQLRAQDFRDNTIDAAEIGEAESGTALYVIQINEDPQIVGGLGKLQVRYRVPATGEYVEHAWPLDMPRVIPSIKEAPASMRLAATSALFAERLANNPHASNYDLDDIESLASDLPKAFPLQSRVVELQNMIQSANSLFTRVE